MTLGDSKRPILHMFKFLKQVDQTPEGNVDGQPDLRGEKIYL